MAVLRKLVAAIGTPTNFKTMARPGLQALGQDALPSPLPPSPSKQHQVLKGIPGTHIDTDLKVNIPDTKGTKQRKGMGQVQTNGSTWLKAMEIMYPWKYMAYSPIQP